MSNTNTTMIVSRNEWVDQNGAYSSLISFACCGLATLISAIAIIGHVRHYGKMMMMITIPYSSK